MQALSMTMSMPISVCIPCPMSLTQLLLLGGLMTFQIGLEVVMVYSCFKL
jgi:hypothetical protein